MAVRAVAEIRKETALNRFDLMDFAIHTGRMARSFGEGIISIDFRVGTDITLSPEMFDAMDFEEVREEKGETSDLTVCSAKCGGIRFTCYKFPEAADGDK